MAASYTFTAAVGALPEGFVDAVSPITHVTVEVVVSVVEPPVITTITAVEGGSLAAGIDDGDTITIEFDAPTNFANLPSNPDTVSQEGVDSLIQLHTDGEGVPPTLGAAYYGLWETSTRFVITIDDSTGANFVVGDEISIRESAGLRTQNELSVASTSRAEVTGSFDPVGLYGQVLNSSEANAPVNNLTVRAYSGTSYVTAQTDVNGYYHFDSLEPGSYTIKIYEDYYYLDFAYETTVVAPSSVGVLYVENAGVITASLVITSGAIPDGYHLRWEMTTLGNWETRDMAGLNLEIPSIPTDTDYWLHFSLVDEEGRLHGTSVAAVSSFQSGLANGAFLHDSAGTLYIDIDDALIMGSSVSVGTIYIEIKGYGE